MAQMQSTHLDSWQPQAGSRPCFTALVHVIVQLRESGYETPRDIKSSVTCKNRSTLGGCNAYAGVKRLWNLHAEALCALRFPSHNVGRHAIITAAIQECRD